MLGVVQLRGEGVASDGILVGNPEVQHVVVNQPVHLMAAEHLHGAVVFAIEISVVIATPARELFEGCQQKQDSFLGSMMLNVKFRQS